MSSSPAAIVSAPNAKKKECFVFEPQQWRKTVCKNCFRLKSEHLSPTESDAAANAVRNTKLTHTSPNSSPTSTSSPQSSGGRSPTDERNQLGKTTGVPPSTSTSLSPRSEFRSHKGYHQTTTTTSNNPASSSSTSSTGQSGTGGTTSTRSNTNPVGGTGGSASGKKSPSPRASANSSGSGGGGGGSGNGSPSSASSHPHHHPSSPGHHSAHGHTAVSPSQMSVDARYVEELENDFFDLEDKYDALVKEKEELNEELLEKMNNCSDLQRQLEEYRVEVASLEKRCLHLDEEVRSYRERLRLPESDQGTAFPSSTTAVNNVRAANVDGSGEQLVGENNELRRRLDEVEQLCQDLMEENELLKEEVEEMQREIEEMHDHFHDEDTDTLRDLQRELEAANKNCRIFQFKLRKAERRYEQCDAERAALEEKMNRLEQEMYQGGGGDLNLIRQLEDQLRNAQEVSIRLNSELEVQDERKHRFESENRQLKDELHDSESRRMQLENEIGRIRLEMDKMRSDGGGGEKGPLQVTDKTQSRNRLTPTQSLSREPSFEEQQLQRELEATKERETDLSETLRSTEDEVRKLKRRLDEVEDENDSLTRRLETFLSKGMNLKVGGRESRGGGGGAESDSDFDEEDVTNMKIQIQLLEEETSILRKKVISLERDNQQLTEKVQVLTKELLLVNRRVADKSNSFEESELRAEVNRIREDLSRAIKDVERLHKENQELSQHLLISSTSSEPPRGDPKREIAIKEFDRRLRQVSREVSIKCSTQETGQKELFDKYQDSCDALKEQTQQLTRFRTRLNEVQEENSELREEVETLRTKVNPRAISFSSSGKRTRRSGLSTKEEISAASKEILIEEIELLEGELDSLDKELREAKIKLTSMQQDIKLKNDLVEEQKTDFEHREKEFLAYIEELESKNGIITNLLDLVQERADELQNDLDGYVSNTLKNGQGSENDKEDTEDDAKRGTEEANGTKVQKVNSQAEVVSRRSTASALSGQSYGSDEVFDSPPSTTISSPIVQTSKSAHEALLDRIRSLERLLNEERARTRAVEKQLEITMRDTPRSRVVGDTKLKDKEIELLKKEIEEKEELLEEMSEQVNDLKQRLDQTRRMNDCLRALVEKEDEISTSSQMKRTRSDIIPQEPDKLSDSFHKEHELEIQSFKMELETAKKELTQLNVLVKEAERTRDRIAKENKLLQEELKVRDITIQEQEEELRDKNRELRQSRNGDRKEVIENTIVVQQSNSSSQKLRDYESECSHLKNELTKKEKVECELKGNLENLQSRFDEKELELAQTEAQMRGLNDAIRLRDDRLNEKDQLLEHMNQRLANREKELSQLDVLLRETQTKLSNAEIHQRELADKLTTMEKEKKMLYMRAEESSAIVEKQKVEIQALRESLSSLSKEKGDLRQEKDDEIALLKDKLTKLESSSTMTTNTYKLGQEVEDLKKDIHRLQFEKAKSEKEWHKEKIKLIEKLNSVPIVAAQSSSLSSKPPPIPSDGRAGSSGGGDSSPISTTTQSTSQQQQQQRHMSKMSMLTDHVSRLNRMNIELKLQNEALHRDMLEYQQKYRACKQEHESQLETWINERAELEVNVRELAASKEVIEETHKSLQDILRQMAELETRYKTEKIDSESKLEMLEKEKSELTVKLSHYENQQKLPKVLQRFSGRSPAAVVPGVGVDEKQINELKVKLEKEEKNLTRLRQEMKDRESEWFEEKRALMEKVEESRKKLDAELQEWHRKQTLLESYRQQKEALLLRLSQLEDNQERERRMWMEERMQLQMKCEELHMMAEQWWDQLKSMSKDVNCPTTTSNTNSADKKADEALQGILKDVLTDLEKFKQIGEKAPYVHMKRSTTEEDVKAWFLQASNSELSDISSMPTTPYSTLQSPRWPNNSTANVNSNLGSRSTSFEWSAQSAAATLPNGPFGGSQFSMMSARCQTPEASSVRKLTNFPDPTPGFLLRSSASVSNVMETGSSGEYSSQCFTMPGNRGPRMRGMSPAKQQFLLDYDAKINQSMANLATNSNSSQPHQVSFASTVTSSSVSTLAPPTLVNSSSSSQSGAVTLISECIPSTSSNNEQDVVKEKKKSSSDNKDNKAQKKRLSIPEIDTKSNKAPKSTTPSRASVFAMSIQERMKLFTNKK